jgi:hypothetical protein
MRRRTAFLVLLAVKKASVLASEMLELAAVIDTTSLIHTYIHISATMMRYKKEKRDGDIKIGNYCHHKRFPQQQASV